MIVNLANQRSRLLGEVLEVDVLQTGPWMADHPQEMRMAKSGRSTTWDVSECSVLSKTTHDASSRWFLGHVQND